MTEQQHTIEHLMSKDPRTGYRWMDVYALRRLREKWIREFFGFDND